MAWLAEWHNYAERNIWKWRTRNKLNRKSYARLCRVFFWQAIFLAQIWRSNRFAGSNQQVKAAPWSSRGLWRKSFLVAASLTGLLGNGRLGSPKWNKQISLVNTCRRLVSQICRFFYLGVYNLYFTKLKSRVNLYRNSSGKRTIVEREVWYIWSLIEYYVTITQHTVSKRKTSHAVSNTV